MGYEFGGEVVRQVFVKQDAHWPGVTHAPYRVPRSPALVLPRGTDGETHRESHRPPGSRRETGWERGYRRRRVSRRGCWDRSARFHAAASINLLSTIGAPRGLAQSCASLDSAHLSFGEG